MKFKKCCLKTDTALPGNELLSAVRQLQPLLENFSRKHYGTASESAAWQNFSRWGSAVIARDEQAYQAAFTAWHLFAWLPDDSELAEERFITAPSDNAIAYDYLVAHRDSLEPLEQSVIQNGIKSPYSFYSIITVISENQLRVQEIYTGQTLIVDGLATTFHAQGDVLFSAVLTVNGKSVLLGCMPHSLHASVRLKVEAHREKWRAEEAKNIDRRLLYLHDTELRRYYFTLLGQAQRAQLH